ncbi:hypothetical protein [Lawsonibacter faecis]|uniref:Uncharacterized protein n=1 Tax=Lawsonibacter faecis TaxID=2763052 RepID=A0A8J6JIP0_9FIRM|nr:hypothetical protein [Lawsonibacter faecis]MBC5735939.1 hypothetical protein [Lawsonibacter faecis]
MAELEEKLNAILGNPEAMGQIVSIAKALTGENGAGAPASADAPGEPQPEYIPVETAPAAEAVPGAPQAAPAESAAQPDWGAIMSLLSGLSGGSQSAQPGPAASSPLGALGDLDPRLIQTAVTLFSEYSATDDRKIALLAALKPFLKEERYAKMDRAIQIAKLSRVIRVAFQLFKKEGQDGDV